MHAPDDLLYSDDDLWIDAHPRDGAHRIGISDYAQDQLGDVVYLELPESGATLRAGQPFGLIESAKAVIDLIAPAAGRVAKRNDAALETPSIVNESPYERGWLIAIADASPAPSLLPAAAYAALRTDP